MITVPSFVTFPIYRKRVEIVQVEFYIKLFEFWFIFNSIFDSHEHFFLQYLFGKYYNDGIVLITETFRENYFSVTAIWCDDFVKFSDTIFKKIHPSCVEDFSNKNLD